MTVRSGRPLGRLLPFAPDEARMGMQLAAIQTGTKRRRRTANMTRVGAAVLALTALVSSGRFAAGPSALAGDVRIETTGGDPRELRLAQGGVVTAEPASRVEIARADAEHIDLRLERGAVRVRTTARQGASVRAGGHVVSARARGVVLAFSVRLGDAGEPPTVDVSEGSVEVQTARGAPRTVSAGERWGAGRASVSPSAFEGPPEDRSRSAGTDPAANEAAVAVAHGVEPARREGGGVGARASAGGARALLDAAERAMAASRPADAARLFDTLRRRHRGDRRAGLAAFELGRLRMDVLDDALGAEEAFRDAAALAVAPSFREDAEARRVQALARAGARGRCVTAREEYLARHPGGVHARLVAEACKGR